VVDHGHHERANPVGSEVVATTVHAATKQQEPAAVHKSGYSRHNRHAAGDAGGVAVGTPTCGGEMELRRKVEKEDGQALRGRSREASWIPEGLEEEVWVSWLKCRTAKPWVKIQQFGIQLYSWDFTQFVQFNGDFHSDLV
jgi:hypothetical protein